MKDLIVVMKLGFFVMFFMEELEKGRMLSRKHCLISLFNYCYWICDVFELENKKTVRF